MGTLYVITCATTGEQYVGATTMPLNIRWSDHKSALRKGKHGSGPLVECVAKNGLQNFWCAKLVEVADEKLAAAERQLIRALNPALNYRESPSRAARHAKPYLVARRRREGVPEGDVDLPRYHSAIRRRRLWKVNDELLTSIEVIERYGKTVMGRLYNGDPHPTRIRYERRQ